jgi:hypothetical protein
LVPTYANSFWETFPFNVVTNVALVFSFLLTLVLTLVAVLYGKRRPVGKPLLWGEAMFGAVYATLVLFLAYGVVPHQWLAYADNELGWRKDKILLGPAGILKPQALGGQFPFTISYEAVRDVIAVLIYVIFLGLQLFIWAWWQKRPKAEDAKPAIAATSSYGRPLVRKG